MTDVLKGLLDELDRGQWPAAGDEPAWDVLRNWCFQEECRLADEAEAERWAAATRALQQQFLPHEEFIERRGELLRERVRARKLLQSRLRWRYGYKTGRRAGLIRGDVRRLHAAWVGDDATTYPSPITRLHPPASGFRHHEKRGG